MLEKLQAVASRYEELCAKAEQPDFYADPARAAQLLKLPPEDCAGVDDALAGVESARTAGMIAAAIGPAALAGAGDWNLECLARLLALCPPLEGGRDL